MFLSARLSLVLVVAIATPAAVPDSVYSPLWLYSGTWRITKKGQTAGAKPDELVNQCALIGKYFSCQQSVNGAVSALLLFVPGKTSGQFYTQSVLPDGRAAGRGELSVEGDKWTFLSNWNQGGKTIFYRTVNVFSGKTQIHFEQQESTDNKDWKTTGAGEEVRVAAGKLTIVR